MKEYRIEQEKVKERNERKKKMIDINRHSCCSRGEKKG